MLDQIDVHDKRLQSEAHYAALAAGHSMRGWRKETIAYGSKQRRRKFVDTYTSECRHCGAWARVGQGLADQQEGTALTTFCEANTGYEDRVIPSFDDTQPRAMVLRLYRDSGRAALKEYA